MKNEKVDIDVDNGENIAQMNNDELINIDSDNLESNIQVQDASSSERMDQVNLVLAEQKMQHQRMIDDNKRGLLQLLRAHDHCQELGKEATNDEFVKEVHKILQNCATPQRDKLKMNTERVHVPIQKIMNNYSKNQKARAEKKRLLKEKQVGEGEVVDEQKFAIDNIWKNLIGEAPLKNPNHDDWRDILSLDDKLQKTLEKYYIEESQEIFIEALEKAKHAWHCAMCNKFFAEPSKSEMIECTNCKVIY